MKARYLCRRTSWKPPLLFLSLPTGFQTEFPPIGPIFFAPHPERDVAIAVRQGDGPTTGESGRHDFSPFRVPLNKKREPWGAIQYIFRPRICPRNFHKSYLQFLYMSKLVVPQYVLRSSLNSFQICITYFQCQLNCTPEVPFIASNLVRY